jgi:hypothetical protein
MPSREYYLGNMRPIRGHIGGLMKTIELDDIFNTLDAWESAAKANEDAANAARVERDSAWDEMDRLAYDYNQLAVELCQVEDQRDEAAGIVRMLIAFTRLEMPYSQLPRWLRKEIEA